MTQSDFKVATAISEVNNIPLFCHEKYVYSTPNMLVNPMLEMTLGTFESDVMEKYYDALQPYLQLIADLRFDCFVKYVGDKRAATHDLTGQGTEIPREGDFVLIKDKRKHNFVKYGVILGFSKNKTKALVRTKSDGQGGWYILPMLYPLVGNNMNRT